MTDFILKRTIQPLANVDRQLSACKMYTIQGFIRQLEYMLSTCRLYMEYEDMEYKGIFPFVFPAMIWRIKERIVISCF